MAYHAIDQSGTLRIGIATSIDGLTWNKESNPVLDVGDGDAWDNVGIAPGTLIDDSMCLKLWYFGIDTSEKIKVGLAITYK